MKVNFNKEYLEKINFQKPSQSNFNNEYKSNPVLQLESFLEKFQRKNYMKFKIFLITLVQYSAFKAYPLNNQIK